MSICTICEQEETDSKHKSAGFNVSFIDGTPADHVPDFTMPVLAQAENHFGKTVVELEGSLNFILWCVWYQYTRKNKTIEPYTAWVDRVDNVIVVCSDQVRKPPPTNPLTP